MDPSDPDGELMLRLQNGDDAALNGLMNRWQVPLVRFIQRYTGNEADSVDLAQETFVRVFQSRQRYKPAAKFSTWLFTIATNLCRNLSRWQRRHPTVTLDGNPEDPDSPALVDTLPAPGENPSGSAEQRDIAAAVQREIQALPHDLRTAVLLFEYENLSYEEIASISGCSTKAVETRLYRARAILRKTLAGLQAS